MKRGIVAAVALALTLVSEAVPVHALCRGDCDGNGIVTVAEIVRGVAITLGHGAPSSCERDPYYCPGSDCGLIDRLVGAVANALHGCPGPLPTPTATPEPIIAALEEVIATQCTWNSPGLFIRQVYATDHRYQITCDSVSGHSSWGDLVRHPSDDDAAAAFLAATSGQPPMDFHELPAAYWVVPNHTYTDDGADRYLVWRLGCWLITAHTFDDTHFQIAANPVPFSEAILSQAGDLLRATCAGS